MVFGVLLLKKMVFISHGEGVGIVFLNIVDIHSLYSDRERTRTVLQVWGILSVIEGSSLVLEWQ